jgi:hypothetical protein
MATAHAQWVEVETRPLRGGVQPVIRRLLRHNAISAWETMQKSGGWKQCRRDGEEGQSAIPFTFRHRLQQGTQPQSYERST